MGVPGVGGVDRGRADAEMIWGSEPPGRAEEFRPELLAGARFMDSESSQMIGVSSAKPEVDPTAEDAGLLDVAASEGQATWRRRLSPGHRRAVKGFFAPSERSSSTPKAEKPSKPPR